jgi:glycogen debranching enzyme
MTLVLERETSINEQGKDVEEALHLLRVENTELYRAAYPGYPGNFSRDSFIYGMLAGDVEALQAQVEYSAQYQGKTTDLMTGEEFGKIHHELPGVLINERLSTYNACDTTALFLLAITSLCEIGDETILGRFSTNIDAAIAYIKGHVHDNLFYEDPKYAGASKFGLKVTYWKDSVINGGQEEPRYPIVYTLPHFQNAAALKAIGHAMNQPQLVELASDMVQTGIDQLWAEDHFIVARDGDGKDIDPPSSDSMHTLLYIEPTILPSAYAKRIEQYTRRLETKAGYRTGLPAGDSDDDYHTRYVWTHEQALLHAAATRHDLGEAAIIAARITNFLDTFPELIDPTDGYKPAGNSPQLWAVGAHQYFADTQRGMLVTRSYLTEEKSQDTVITSAVLTGRG